MGVSKYTLLPPQWGYTYPPERRMVDRKEDGVREARDGRK